MQTEQILQAYANRKLIRRYCLFGVVGVDLLWLMVANNWFVPQWLFIGGLVLTAAVTIFILWRYWRCPACERTLGREQYVHCPHCGERLEA